MSKNEKTLRWFYLMSTMLAGRLTLRLLTSTVAVCRPSCKNKT